MIRPGYAHRIHIEFIPEPGCAFAIQRITSVKFGDVIEALSCLQVALMVWYAVGGVMLLPKSQSVSTVLPGEIGQLIALFDAHVESKARFCETNLDSIPDVGCPLGHDASGWLL